MFCEAVIVRNPDNPSSRALAHVLSGAEPDEYMSKLANLFPPYENASRPNLEAVVIKAGGPLRTQLMKACKQRNINIIQVIDVPTKDQFRARKYDVIVDPRRKKVTINIEGIGLRTVDF